MDKNKIEIFNKKIEALKAAKAQEQVKEQKLKAKLTAREFSTIGEALVKYASQSADFRLMLKQVLASAISEDADRKFLASRGWLLNPEISRHSSALSS